MMTQHPSSFLDEELVQYLRGFSPKAELQGKLTGEQFEVVIANNWLRLFLPTEYKGLNLALPEAVRLEEALAWVDGSLGWVVTLCAGAGFFAGFLQAELAGEIFSEPEACLAGSGKLNGTALAQPGGFLVNGQWPYASGAAHATHFTANCTVSDGTRSYISSFIFTREEVKTKQDWHFIGLNGTSGHSYGVKNLTIPDNRSFTIRPEAAVRPEPIYRYPFLPLAETTIAANISGMTLYFLELADPILKRKGRGKGVVERAINTLNQLRHDFYAALDLSWTQHLAGALDPQQILEVGRRSRALAQGARKQVNEVYPYCGLEAAAADSMINQVWRNIHTGGQHSLLLPSEG